MKVTITKTQPNLVIIEADCMKVAYDITDLEAQIAHATQKGFAPLGVYDPVQVPLADWKRAKRLLLKR